MNIVRGETGQAAARVIIVNDSAAASSAMSEALQEAGYCVYWASGLKQMRVLAQRLEAPPRVAVVDMHLHDGSGVQVCQELRARWPDLFVIVCAWLRVDESDALRFALSAPATALLTMPYNLDQLVDAVGVLPAAARRACRRSPEEAAGGEDAPLSR